jgi:regulatory protein
MPSKECRDECEKAKGYALRLFKLRPRTSFELAGRLRDRHFDGRVARRTIAELKRTGVIDDRKFIRAWFQERLLKYGYRRICAELLGKGLPKGQIDQVWQDISKGYDEDAVVSGIVAGRRRSYASPDALKARRSMAGHLIRKGFSGEAVARVLKVDPQDAFFGQGCFRC